MKRKIIFKPTYVTWLFLSTTGINAVYVKDLQAKKLEDVLEYTAGTAPSNSFGNSEDRISIRGFDANIAEDGIVTFGGGSRADSFRKRSSATIESVEVLSGGQGVLFGAGGLGGTVNIVTKKPEIGRFLRTSSTYSTEGLLRQDLDLNLSFGSIDEYRFRFITSAEDDDRDFRDRTDGDTSFLRGIFQYNPNDDFTLTLGVEHSNVNSFFDRGVPIDQDGNLLTDRSVNLTPNGLGHTDIDYTALDAKVEYSFSDSWTLNSTTRYEESGLEGDSITAFGVFSSPIPLGLLNPAVNGQFLLPNQTITRTPLFRDTENEVFTTRAELKGAFNTGSLSHESLFSLEYIDSESVIASRQPIGGAFSAIALAVDLQNLVIDPPALPGFDVADPVTSSIETFAISAFDKITVNDSLNVVLGGRVDFVDTETSSVSAGGLSDFSETEFSPTVGVNYAFNDQFSTYAVYSESFQVNTADPTTGEVIDPREGRNFELGFRYNIPNTKLTLNASVFDIEETNRPFSDPSTFGSVLESGTFESRGVDFKLQGEVTDNVSLILNYVYNDTEFTEATDPFALGSDERGIPEHQASLFVSYDFTPDEVKGLTLNAGIVYVGERIDTVPTTVFQLIPQGGNTLQDYVRVDVGARYNFGEHKSIGVNIENLFDKDYERVGVAGSALPEAPRTAFVSFDWEF